MNILLAFFLSLSLRFTVSTSIARGEYGEIKLFQSPATYSVESMVLLNDAGRKDKEVGYKVNANLDVQAVWGIDSEFLLKFDLRYPKLLGKGKSVTADYLPIKSFWDSYPNTEFFAYWKHGLIAEAYLDPEELPDVLNYKKSLISLFQLQIIDGEHNETDISGICDVVYDSISMQVIRKTKRQCRAVGAVDGNTEDEVVTSRRLTRYTLSEKLDGLEEVHAEEVHTAGFQNMEALVKARAWLRLRRSGAPAPASFPSLPSLAAALAELPAKLKPLPLPMVIADEPLDEEEKLEEVLEEAIRGGEDEEAGGGGTARAAAAGLRALRALRSAPAHRLAAALRAQHADALVALCRLLGAAGAAGAHEAAALELSLNAHEHEHEQEHEHEHDRDHEHVHAHARHYLNALALAHQPDEEVVEAVARAGVEGRARALREAALLAAAAAAASAADSKQPRLALALRDTLAQALARCKEESCRGVAVRALGNLRRADTAELLLAQAEARGAPAVALGALQALGALPAAALGPARQRRLAALAARRGPLAVRAAALDLLLVRAAPLPPPLALARLARELQAHAPHELRRLFWQRARQLAADHRPLHDVLHMLAPDLRGWDALAQPGTSSVLVRSLGRMGPGSARLESLQLARGGMLQRGSVRLLLDDVPVPAPLLAIELWTKGLESLAGGEATVDEGEEGDEEEGSEAEDMAAGLALTVAGARLPAITLFNGQAELLGHVWAGTGSTATPVLRALLPLGERAAAVPLLGAAPLRVRAGAALSLALDAQAQVSMWSRTALAELALRLGAAGDVRAAVRGAARGAGYELTARAQYSAEPRLHVRVHVDAHQPAALCVRLHTDDYHRWSNVTLSSSLGDGARGVRRARAVRVAQPGRTLALGARNDAACRAL
ncbi:unnamed protein product [Parnassius mnemosyne]|uniref:Vitellogenin domain-containing protein n=1 Tax=Parnassius mnemosyne TaxID=213953 RepID=A0AAV1KUX0_9NEOP